MCTYLIHVVSLKNQKYSEPVNKKRKEKKLYNSGTQVENLIYKWRGSIPLDSASDLDFWNHHCIDLLNHQYGHQLSAGDRICTTVPPQKSRRLTRIAPYERGMKTSKNTNQQHEHHTIEDPSHRLILYSIKHSI